MKFAVRQALHDSPGWQEGTNARIRSIISDLDGTLLDSANYSFAAALPSLGMIRARGVPLVLCASKTRAEMEVYRRRLDNSHPFITGIPLLRYSRQGERLSRDLRSRADA